MSDDFWIELVKVCGPLLGVLLGALGTYMIQKRILEQQRKWALDDQRRKFLREDLERKLMPIMNYVRAILSDVGLRRIEKGRDFELSGKHAREWYEMRSELMKKIAYDQEAAFAVRAIDDVKLTRQWTSLVEAVVKISEAQDLVGVEEWETEAGKIARKIDKRRKELIEETLK